MRTHAATLPSIGVLLPTTPGPDGATQIHEAARYAEVLGLDSIWIGDHLATGTPVLESTIAIATAAAVTDRIAVGISVFIPAIRPLAWAAKQIATLQHLTAGRLILGIGSGGPSPQWQAAGVPQAERGRRTDHALALLPSLLAGHSTRLDDDPNNPPVTLAPAAPMPPIWIGGNSAVARRRAATHGDAWFPSIITTAAVAAGAARLHDLAVANHRPTPQSPSAPPPPSAPPRPTPPPSPRS